MRPALQMKSLSCHFMPRPHEGLHRDVLLACAELVPQSAYLLFLAHLHRERTVQTKAVLPQSGPERVEGTHARWNRIPDAASQAAEVLRSLGCALLHVWCLGQDRSSHNVWATSQTPTGWHCLVSTQEPSRLHSDVGGSTARGVPCPQLFLWPWGLLQPLPHPCPIGHTSSASLACQPTNWSNHPLAGLWGASSPTEVTMAPGPLKCGYIATHTSLGQGSFCILVDTTHHLHLGGRHPISATPVLMLCVYNVPAPRVLRAQELRVPAVPPPAPLGKSGQGFFLLWQLLGSHLGLCFFSATGQHDRTQRLSVGGGQAAGPPAALGLRGRWCSSGLRVKALRGAAPDGA